MGKKEKKEPKLKTPEEREKEVKEIMNMLTSLKLNTRYDGILDFYKQLSDFKKTGDYSIVKIELPQFGREIQGFLTNKVNCPSQIKLVSI